jgi:hypothetical protein
MVGLWQFFFPYISAPGARIFKIFVSTPHNTPLIMGDRHKNFEDPSTWSLGRDIRKTKFDLLGFFEHPLVLVSYLKHGTGRPEECSQAKNFQVENIWTPETTFVYSVVKLKVILPTPGKGKAKEMPGRLYIHTKWK